MVCEVRKCVSVSGKAHALLKAEAERQDRTIAAVLEDLILDALDEAGERDEAMRAALQFFPALRKDRER